MHGDNYLPLILRQPTPGEWDLTKAFALYGTFLNNLEIHNKKRTVQRLVKGLPRRRAVSLAGESKYVIKIAKRHCHYPLKRRTSVEMHC